MEEKPRKKKKILYIITKSNWGGAQRYVYDLATSLPRERFDVTVAFGGDGMLKEALERAKIRTVPLPSLYRDIHLAKETQTFFEFLRLIRSEHPDILHINSSKAGGIGALAGRLSGVDRVIFTAHGWAFNEERPWWQKTILYFFSWLTVVLSHTTIAVSQKTKDQIAWLPFIDKKIVVIPNGIRIPEFKHKEQAREFLSSKNGTLRRLKDTLWIGTVAELHTTKGLEYAIEAIGSIAEQFPELMYIIIGEGEQRKQLESLIQGHQLENRVFLLGFVEEAARYLKAFDIFLIPSLSEALSYVLLEAGAAGLPVIATAVGGIPEVIKDKKSGTLISPYDSYAIAGAIRNSLVDKKDSALVAAALTQHVRNKFSIQKMFDQTATFYVNC